MTRQPVVFAMLLFSLSVLVPACGIGIIYFEPRNGGPTKGALKDFKAYEVDCQDGFEASGGQTVMGAEAGTYSVACSREGQPMTAKLLGIFHAAPAAGGKWGEYRAHVTQRARDGGCPAVAIRKTPPTKNQQGEAIGAFCVES